MSLFSQSVEAGQSEQLQRWRDASKIGAGESRAEFLAAAISAASPGASKEDVRAALGAPNNDYQNEWLYNISIDFFMKDAQYLIVLFDDAGVVLNATEVRSEDYVTPPNR